MQTDTKKTLILWAACLTASLLITPYIQTVESAILASAGITFPMLVLISAVQGGVIFGIAAFFGVKLANKTGFEMPLLGSWLEGKKLEYGGTAKWSALLGIAAGTLITLIDRLGFQGEVTSKFSVPLWQGFLACFYGGIAEEVLMRLFLLSLWVLLLLKIFGRKEKSPAIVWTGILLISVLFGLGHLPITSAVVGITPMVVFRAILLNGIGGVIFGWLYWKKGLESAIIAHFSADVVLQVAVPLLSA